MIITVAIVDDHRMLREALKTALSGEPGIEIVGEAGNGSDALKLVAERSPMVLLLDIRMPGMNGIDVARALRTRNDPVKVLAVTAHNDKQFVQEMLKAGAAGYVSKTGSTAQLVEAIRTVAHGQSYFSPEISRVLASEYAVPRPQEAPPISSLTPREREVLTLLAEGNRSASIAAELDISVGTVEIHRRNIMEKLRLHTVAELTKYAIREGLTTL